jgi:hypothetical protein
MSDLLDKVLHDEIVEKFLDIMDVVKIVQLIDLLTRASRNSMSERCDQQIVIVIRNGHAAYFNEIVGHRAKADGDIITPK